MSTSVPGAVVELGATAGAVDGVRVLDELVVVVGSLGPTGLRKSAVVVVAGSVEVVCEVDVVGRTVAAVVVGAGFGSSSEPPPPRGCVVGTGKSLPSSSSGNVVLVGADVVEDDVVDSIEVVDATVDVVLSDELGVDPSEVEVEVLAAVSLVTASAEPSDSSSPAAEASVAAAISPAAVASLDSIASLAAVTVVEVSARAALGQRANEPDAKAAPIMTATAAFVFSLRRWDTALLTLSGALLRLSRPNVHGSRASLGPSVG